MAYKFEPWREKLRAAIVVSGLNDRQLALRSGLSEGYIRHIIKERPGKNGEPPRPPIKPTVEKLHAIVKTLDLTLDDLFDDEDLNTNDILATMADRGFARLFSQIKDLSPKERVWLLGALEQQMELLDKIPSKSQLKPAPIKLIRQSDSD